MIDCPDVDDMIEFAPYKLVVMIGNITGKVGRHTVRADHDFIFVILGIFAGCKPDCTVTPFKFAALIEIGQRLVNQPFGIKTLLAKPVVKLYPNACQLRL